MSSLIDLGSALATYGGLIYFGKSSFLSFMSCLHTNRFSYQGCTIYVHYYSSLLNGRIHTNIYLFIHVIQSLFVSLFFLCMLVRILSSKIYFLCFFLASLLIALIYYFYTFHVRLLEIERYFSQSQLVRDPTLDIHISSGTCTEKQQEQKGMIPLIWIYVRTK